MQFKLIAMTQQIPNVGPIAALGLQLQAVEPTGLVRPIQQDELSVAVGALERVINREAAALREEIAGKKLCEQPSQEVSKADELGEEPPGNNRILEP